MTVNDIFVRPAKQQIMIDESTVVDYGSLPDQSSCNRVPRTRHMFLGPHLALQ